MQKNFYDSNIPLLDKIFKEWSCFSVSFSRDATDSFSLSIDRTRNLKTDIITREDVFPLLPPGSNWIQAVGWSSYFGIPLRIKENVWYAIGAIDILPHSHRGAYPVIKAYLNLLEFLPLKELEILVNELDTANILKKGIIKDPFEGSRAKRLKILRATSMNKEEHKFIEAWIINYAIEAYRRKSELMFRTLLLSYEENFDPNKIVKISTTSSICSKESIIATVDPILKFFPRKVQEKLSGKELIEEKWEKIAFTEKDDAEKPKSVTTQPDKKKCFIATSIYGGEDLPSVLILCQFRDKILKKNSIGRIFINFYYKIAPSLSKVISKDSFLRKPLKFFLDLFVILLNKK